LASLVHWLMLLSFILAHDECNQAQNNLLANDGNGDLETEFYYNGDKMFFKANIIENKLYLTVRKDFGIVSWEATEDSSEWNLCLNTKEAVSFISAAFKTKDYNVTLEQNQLTITFIAHISSVIERTIPVNLIQVEETINNRVQFLEQQTQQLKKECEGTEKKLIASEKKLAETENKLRYISKLLNSAVIVNIATTSGSFTCASSKWVNCIKSKGQVPLERNISYTIEMIFGGIYSSNTDNRIVYTRFKLTNTKTKNVIYVPNEGHPNVLNHQQYHSFKTLDLISVNDTNIYEIELEVRALNENMGFSWNTGNGDIRVLIRV